jgi:starch-binding outer membrane protein, SusD/RagB family
MFIKSIIISSLGLSVAIVSLSSCKKYLETKSVQTLSTPSTLDDLQLMLDNPIVSVGLNLTNTSTDEYYLKYTDWDSRPEISKNAYIWDPVLDNISDWSDQYRIVYYTNNVLHNIESVPAKGQEERKATIQGAALFYRAHSFFQIAQLFSPQFDAVTASSDLGIPLRLNVDINDPSTRASVQQTYDQIIKDLNQASELSPTTQVMKTRPGKNACFGMLARVYLQMGDYAKAKEAADKCIQISNSLLDYNSLDTLASYPLGQFINNPEIIYYSRTDAPLAAEDSRVRMDTNLVASYQPNDLRRKVFFRTNTDKSFAFKGNYSGGYDLFNGVAVDEIYLIRAECYAREGNTSAALQDLNTLLIKRWKKGTFVPYNPPTADQALDLIIKERKKELIFRALRWPDLKRLNKDSRFAITLKRELNGQIYLLPPNDLRYTMLIPLQVMNIANLTQNSR